MSNELLELLNDAHESALHGGAQYSSLDAAIAMVEAGEVRKFVSWRHTADGCRHVYGVDEHPCLVIPLTPPVVVTDADREDAKAVLETRHPASVAWDAEVIAKGAQALAECRAKRAR